MSERAFYREINPTAAQAPLIFATIEHPDLSEPVRIVRDNQDQTRLGDTYTGFAFNLTLPTQANGQYAIAKMVIDNVGRDLMGLLEESRGASGANFTIVETSRADTDTAIRSIELELVSVSADRNAITFELGADNPLAQPAIRMRFDPSSAPGLFEG